MDHPLIQIAIKFATLVAPLGGPHMVMDALRPLIGKPAAVIIACAPVVLMYVGADALAAPETGRWRTILVRVGLGGAILLAAMNSYAVWRILARDEVFVGDLTIVGLVVGTVAIVVYAILAHRVLRRAPPKLDGRTLQDFGGTID